MYCILGLAAPTRGPHSSGVTFAFGDAGLCEDGVRRGVARVGGEGDGGGRVMGRQRAVIWLVESHLKDELGLGELHNVRC